ncbi:hypothetical protein O9H85_37085 [Paenibacillus filicis]|uniref:DUF4386 family protein n=1 Tax=Paenibacillus gyeongsangnamensis TaxID=3388067 RepID=A0ABT4QLQ1_9BACL|nr:hypothetical protein [Paenibacillus filicis]MCZ8517804.1 hypothetical protein [Paenibacillus filicis]
MNTNRQTAVMKGSSSPHAKRRAAITAQKLIRSAGFAAMASGILFIVIQTIHPADILSSVTTGRWAIIHCLSVAMCFLGLIGIAGIYARQVEEAGWLGLAGYLLLSLFYALTMAFQFVEAFISPVLATEAPKLEESFLGIVSGTVGEVNLGALATVYALTGVLYLLGGLLFGIAVLRTGILSRWGAGLLAVSTILPLLLSSLVHHPYDRIFALPMGISLAWLGYSLWSERREKA